MVPQGCRVGECVLADPGRNGSENGPSLGPGSDRHGYRHGYRHGRPPQAGGKQEGSRRQGPGMQVLVLASQERETEKGA